MGPLFPEGELDVVIDSRNSNKMAAVYTVHTSLIRIFNCLSFPNFTLKNLLKVAGRHFLLRYKLIVHH